MERYNRLNFYKDNWIFVVLRTGNGDVILGSIFYKISLTAFNFFISLSNETTILAGDDPAVRMQSTISILVLPYFRSASRISDLLGFTIPDRVNNWFQIIDYLYTIHGTHNFMGILFPAW